MVQFNFFRREVNCKIVYYGPGLSGKTTNLEIVHKKTPGTNRGDLTSIATEQDRTLFFDFMPIDLGTVAGMKTKLRLFTVPGQVFYNSTRKLVLQGADGVIFVADSQEKMVEENLESLRNLEENLKEHGMKMGEMPLVLQWNKRDMPGVLPVAELEKRINYYSVPTFEAVAVTGEGVFPTLKKCAALVLDSVNKKAQESQKSSFSLNKSPSKGPSIGKGGIKPGLAKPGAKGPVMAKPGVAKPGGVKPGAAKPGLRPGGGAAFRSQTPKPTETPPAQQAGKAPSPPLRPSASGSSTAGAQGGGQKPLFKKFKKFLDKEKGGLPKR